MNDKDSRFSNQLSHIIFITGGTKSGKSEFAEHLAKEVRNLSYVALSENNKQDKLWQEKISLHQRKLSGNQVNLTYMLDYESASRYFKLVKKCLYHPSIIKTAYRLSLIHI